MLKIFSPCFAHAASSPQRTGTQLLEGKHAKLPHAFTISNYLSPVCLSGPVIAGADEMAQFSFT